MRKIEYKHTNSHTHHTRTNRRQHKSSLRTTNTNWSWSTTSNMHMHKNSIADITFSIHKLFLIFGFSIHASWFGFLLRLWQLFSLDVRLEWFRLLFFFLHSAVYIHKWCKFIYDFKRRYFKQTHVDHSLALSVSVDRQTKNEIVGSWHCEFWIRYEVWDCVRVWCVVCVCEIFFL